MPELDVLVRGGTVVTARGATRADVGIADGAIVAVEAGIAASARETIDARDHHVLPGAVDPHVHFNEPGRADWEGFATGSAALAAGGGTSFIDMPLNSTPVTTSAAALHEKRRLGEAASVTDFALWGGLVPGNIGALEDLAAAGASGFKAFMSDSGLPEFPRVDDHTLLEGLRAARELGLVVAVHAENDDITRALAIDARRDPARAARAFVASRPAIAELEAIHRAVFLAEEAGASLHVVHVSTARGVAIVLEARARGVDVTCETCPHYLAFTADDLERAGAALKCAPPLRDAAERDALWAAVRAGHVDWLASDHSPAPPDLKGGDLLDAWGGIDGVQFTLLVALDRVARGELSVDAAARLTATAAAARFRLPGKGRVEPGFDADLAIVDLNAVTVARPEDVLTRHRLSPYAGVPFRAAVRRVLRRGETIAANGRATRAGGGRFIRPRA